MSEVKRSSVRFNLFDDEEFDFQFLRVMGSHYNNGASIGECLSTAKRIKDGDQVSWVKEWHETAALVESEAVDYLNKGQRVSAREAFLRASMYYRSAEYYGFFSTPDRRMNWLKSRYCLQEAGKLSSTTSLEVLEIPFEDMNLIGYFISPLNTNEPRPTLILMTGFDGTSEELYFLGLSATERGYNALIFEGPGQAGPSHLYPENHFIPDYEKPVKAVVDYAISRSDVDDERLALLGLSLGGYFVSRAIIFEKRIKACIIDTPIVDIYSYFSMFPGVNELEAVDVKDYEEMFKVYPKAKWSIETFERRYGFRNFKEVREYMKEFNIVDLLDNITTPTLTLVGSGEGDMAMNQAKLFYDKVSGPKDIHIFTEDEGADAHCQVANSSLMLAVIFDWLERIFIEY
jgi:esterase/lipase